MVAKNIRPERAREMAGLKVDGCADQRFAAEEWA
jgi:hypothetical protein